MLQNVFGFEKISRFCSQQLMHVQALKTSKVIYLSTFSNFCIIYLMNQLVFILDERLFSLALLEATNSFIHFLTSFGNNMQLTGTLLSPSLKKKLLRKSFFYFLKGNSFSYTGKWNSYVSGNGPFKLNLEKNKNNFSEKVSFIS